MSNTDNQKEQDKRKKLILMLHQELYSIISKEAASSTGIKPNPSIVIQQKANASAEIGRITKNNHLVNLLRPILRCWL